MSEPLSTSAAAPSVCIIMAAKNAESTIGRAITSALQQSGVSEIIVVDDGSDDDTLAVAHASAQGSDRLIAISLPENRGPAAARNMALARATADFVCVLDSDDFMLPDRLSKMLPQAADCDVLGDDLFFCTTADPTIKARDLLGLRDGHTRFVGLEEFVRSNITQPNQPRREMGFLKPLISRSFLLERGLNYREDLRLGEDYALYVEALQNNARFKLMEACGYVSVERGDSLSARHTIDDLRALRDFDAAMLAFPLPDGERSAIAAHMFNTACRLDHRRMLQAKKEGHYSKAVAILFETPGTAAYIMRSILRDKTGF
jgi:succinoglycan biosynthesis protein ExoU